MIRPCDPGWVAPGSVSAHIRPGAVAPASVTDAGLGMAIRARRVKLGLRQDTLARLANIDRAVMSRLERGERPLRITEFVAIAGALNIGAETLLKLAFRTDMESAAWATMSNRDQRSAKSSPTPRAR